MSDYVTVEISGKPHELKPTLAAARRINGYSKGLRNALDNAQMVDLETIAVIVGSGIGYKTPDEFEAMAQTIYREGVGKFVTPAIAFLLRLMNGGKEPSAEPDGESPKGNE